MNNNTYRIKHIYNGIVFNENGFWPMIEFKIISEDSDLNNNSLENNKHINKSNKFKDVDYECAWFLIDIENSKLIGPVKLNTQATIDNKRTIDDDRFPKINKCTIESITNDIEMLINDKDIPLWMLNYVIAQINI